MLTTYLPIYIKSGFNFGLRNFRNLGIDYMLQKRNSEVTLEKRQANAVLSSLIVIVRNNNRGDQKRRFKIWLAFIYTHNVFSLLSNERKGKNEDKEPQFLLPRKQSDCMNFHELKHSCYRLGTKYSKRYNNC